MVTNRESSEIVLAINELAMAITQREVAKLEAEIAGMNLTLISGIGSYLEKNPDDIEGAREKFGIEPMTREQGENYSRSLNITLGPGAC